MTATFRIVNGRVYDPINGIDGEVRDVCVQDGKIVASVPPEAKQIDASGMVVMPGGVDIHCHIAGPKVNLARKLQPEDHRFDVHPRTATSPFRHGRLHFRHRLPLRRLGCRRRWKRRSRRSRAPHPGRAARHAHH